MEENTEIIQQMDEELREVRHLYNKVEQSLLKYKALKESCIPGAVRYDTDRVQTTPENRMENKLIDATNFQSEYIKCKGDYEYRRMTTLDKIRKLDNDKEAAVLIQYYINFKSWWQISVSMGISDATVHRIRKRALEHYAKIK